MNVVRSVLGSRVWGDLAFTNPTVGAIFTKTYSYKIPTGSNYLYTKVIGMVENNDNTMSTTPVYAGMPDYYNNRVIENAIMARVRLMKPSAGVLSTADMNKLEGVSLFPNPASNTINVQYNMANPLLQTNISITNAVGQVVIEKQFPAFGSQFSENISVSNLAEGVYFMKINANGQTVAKEFTISR